MCLKKINYILFFVLFCSFCVLFLKCGNSYSYYSNSMIRNLDIVSKNKVIVIGDSRFRRIVSDYSNYDIPINFDFIAEDAKEVNWFKNDAEEELNNILKKKDDDKIYHVVINMGVNDIQFYRPFVDSINSYKEEYDKLIKKYPDVYFYILSINPIDEEKLNISQPYNLRTNDQIQFFNDELFSFSKDNGIKYCFADKSIDFDTLDGIHYDSSTNQEILNYIASRCVNYKYISSR